MDCKLSWDAGGADLVLDKGDLARDEGLVTPTLLSLFSDALAPLDPALPAFEQERRGYWAEDPADPYGSRLWLLARSKATADTSSKGQEYSSGALAWFVAQGIAREVRVTTTWRFKNVLAIEVHMTRGTARRWQSLWGTMKNLQLSVSGPLLQVTYS